MQMLLKMKCLSSAIILLGLCPLVIVQATRLRGSTSAMDAESSGASAMVIDHDIDRRDIDSTGDSDMPSDRAELPDVIQ